QVMNKQWRHGSGGRQKAVLLDRDGTLLDQTGYLGDPDGIAFYPGVPGALKRLQEEGFLLLVITNQSGVGRCYFDEETAIAVNIRMAKLLMDEGVFLAGIYYCPHHPDAGCRCRKPGTFMGERAMRDFHVSPERSWVVGDTERDVVMGTGMGIRSILLDTGKEVEGVVPDSVIAARDLSEATEHILAEEVS
ncbi:MAG: HAD family hydrolase, partial [bacterium]